MSTLKAINLQHPSSSSVNIVLDSSANASVTGNLAMQSTGGGSITFTVPSTASAFTLTLPAATAKIAAFASGTAMLFAQTAAPTGWTKSTTHDNKALRVVSGTASSGGTVAFTTAFASQSVSGTVGSTTLALSQIPSHSHAPSTGGTYLLNDGSGTGLSGGSGTAVNYNGASSSQGSSGSHNHSFTGTAINLAVQYVDVIIATVD